MIIELGENQLRVDSERPTPIDYKGRRIKGELKVDCSPDLLRGSF
jgi:hypothetical protein